jgi:hypothetical protein
LGCAPTFAIRRVGSGYTFIASAHRDAPDVQRANHSYPSQNLVFYAVYRLFKKYQIALLLRRIHFILLELKGTGALTLKKPETLLHTKQLPNIS